MPDKWPDDLEEELVVHPQAIENQEETERWAEEKERGKRVEKEQVFEDENETKGWEEGKKKRE